MQDTTDPRVESICTKNVRKNPAVDLKQLSMDMAALEELERLGVLELNQGYSLANPFDSQFGRPRGPFVGGSGRIENTQLFARR